MFNITCHYANLSNSQNDIAHNARFCCIFSPFPSYNRMTRSWPHACRPCSYVLRRYIESTGTFINAFPANPACSYSSSITSTSRTYQSTTSVCRTYSRYERRVKGIFREPKQYARFANSRVSDQQQLEQIIVRFCHRHLRRITSKHHRPINSILGRKLTLCHDSAHYCSSSRDYIGRTVYIISEQQQQESDIYRPATRIIRIATPKV